MASERLGVVLKAMADADPGGTASMVDRVCGAAGTLLSLSGAGVSLMADGELRGTAGVSEAGIEAVQELQLTLGEGPCVDAWRDMEPVLEADLADPVQVRWPAFAHAGVQAGVRAVFAFPLQLGAVGLGVLVLYRDRPAMLGDDELALGLVLAEVATQTILGLQAGAPADELHVLLADEPAHWAEIHQATGIVSVQLEVSLDEAFVRLRSFAFADDRPLREVAEDIVARRLRLPGAR
ncbi:MAG TPA: GAF and ANTAR domain-containing protein [Solirubrobacteraceae bacterium]|nr:GAF and ANTAR domain-containing protein [Solirubrobacteraceae bacterium]